MKGVNHSSNLWGFKAFDSIINIPQGRFAFILEWKVVCICYHPFILFFFVFECQFILILQSRTSNCLLCSYDP